MASLQVPSRKLGYLPRPVRRVDIAKPSGGVRTLGIPTVVDRLIQQALRQVLSPLFEPTFSDRSYGFRPGRSAAQAVKQAQAYIRDGKRWVVDLDLEKFFDRVNHDVLMSRVARRVREERVRKLIRRFLEAGLMQDGVATARTEGTPQGGPLSPLLRGWMAYFQYTQSLQSLESLDEWRRRCLLWRQWKRSANRARQLRRLGLDEDRAWRSAVNGRGPWWNAGASPVAKPIFEPSHQPA